MAIEKGLLVAAGLVFAGVVGYKVIKKKKPDAFKNVRESVCNIKKRTFQIVEGAKDSFREGYAKA